jgi:tRNA dimethylallyltransferase
VASYLEGRTTLDQAVEATTAATRRFSRRQDGWFRKDPRVVWLPWDAPDRVDRAEAAIRAVTVRLER